MTALVSAQECEDTFTFVVARIEGLDTTRPEEIRLGTPLQVGFLRRGTGDEARAVLAFAPG